MAVQLALPLGTLYTPAAVASTSVPGNNPFSASNLSGPARPGGNSSEAAAPMARAAAAGEAGKAGQQWLSRFGTARLQLNLDDNFKFDNSAADVLIPLYETPKSTLFTQLGARNKDDRNTVNLGAGVRTQQGNWLYGVNTFYDYDMTGKNQRLGVGAEAWTDYLKLSSNGYFGLSDWRQSRDFADYKERPANGFDLRAEAWLPSHPQLGGKLIYEQYQGDNVALFGKNIRQKDPYALTANVNYTPIPLLTVGGEHRTGKGGASDSSINLQLNYRLGESWASHLDPSRVAASRTLAGSRYDLVERNNNIVLDYQKQESTVRLALPASLAGFAGQTLIVQADITASNGVDRLEWDSAALVAAGGTVSQTSPQILAVTLPPHQTAAKKNTYAIGAVAYDRKGNVSNRASTIITVNTAETEEVETGPLRIEQFDVVANNAPADGNAVNRVRAMVTDGDGTPAADAEVYFSADNGAVVLDAMVRTDRQGRAETRLTQTMPGITSVTARSGENTRRLEVEFMATTPLHVNATISSQTMGNKTADDNDHHRLTVTVRDENGQAVPDYAVSFNASEGARLSQNSGKTGPDGSLSLDVTTTRAGTVVVTAKGDGVEATSEELRFVAGAASQATSTITALTSGWRIIGSSNPHRIEVKLMDAFSNPIEGQSVSFTSKEGGGRSVITPAQKDTGPDGTIEVEIRSTGARNVVLIANTGSFTLESPSSIFITVNEIPCDDDPDCRWQP